MFTPGEFRKKALGYGDLVKTAVAPEQKLRFEALEQSFTQLANNEQWLADNHSKTIGAAEYAQIGTCPLKSRPDMSKGSGPLRPATAREWLVFLPICELAIKYRKTSELPLT